jgi:hypothetical protein
MSIQIRAGQQRALRGGMAGDPGLFDVIGKVVGGVAKVASGAVGGFLSGGPVGAIGGAITSIIKPSTSKPTTVALPFASPQVQRLPTLTSSALPGIGTAVSSYGPATSSQGGAPGQFCLKGYHKNKSAYFHKRLNMWVDEGSACVKNRRMNPLNPRAASRAMRRLDGFSKATRSVEKMMVKIARKNAPRGSRGGGFKKAGCGCRKR